MALSFEERHDIAELLVLMFNAAPGATILNQIVSVFEANGRDLHVLADILATVPAYTSTHPSALLGTEFADQFLEPLGLKGDYQATKSISEAYDSGVAPGDISYAALEFLNNVYQGAVTEGHPGNYAPQYVAAAKLVYNKAEVSIYYSVTKGLSATDLADLQAVLAGVTSDPATVAAAEAAIDHANDPQVFTATLDGGAAQVTEGDAGTKVLTFTIHLVDANGNAPAHAVTLNYSTASTGSGDGHATANDDYVPAAGTITFAPGQTQATVQVTILGDVTFESNETLKLVVSGATLAGVSHSVEFTGTILNDDPVPQINLTPLADVVLPSDLSQQINGTQETFTLDDNIDGGGGDDTLKLVFDGTPSDDPEVIVAPFVTVANVEHVVIFSDLSVGGVDDPAFSDDNGSEIAFDMSTWTGVETVDISAAAGADVNLHSAASGTITIHEADNVQISDNTVADVEVVKARGFVDITTSDATTIHVGKAGGHVSIDTTFSDGSTPTTNITVDNAGYSDVYIDTYDGNISVAKGEDVFVNAHDAFSISVTDSNGYVGITASDVTTIEAESNSDAVVISADDVGSVDVDADGYANVLVDTLGSGTVVAHGGGVTVDASTSIGSLTATNEFGPVLDQTVTTVTIASAFSDAPGATSWVFSDSSADAVVEIGFGGFAGEDDTFDNADDVFISAGTLGNVGIADAGDVLIYAGSIESVALSDQQFSDSDQFNVVDIVQTSDTDLNLSLDNASIESLAIIGATTVNLDVAGDSYANFAGGMFFSDGTLFISDDATVEVINVTGSGTAELNVIALAGTLTDINGSDATADLTIEALGTININTGSGDDTVLVLNDGGDADVSVHAGSGNNNVDVHNGAGATSVIVGDGDDVVEVSFATLANADTSIALGAGENTLIIRTSDGLTDGDLNDINLGSDGLPVTGSLHALIFDAYVELGEDSATTLDVSGLDGTVEVIGFSDVDTNTELGSADLTIVGAGETLLITSGNDFGEGGQINLDAQGVTDLTIDAGDEVNVALMGDSVETLTVDAGGDVTLALDGDVDGDGSDDQLGALASVTVSGEDVNLDVSAIRNSATIMVNATSDATVNISDSTLGNVTVNFGSDANTAIVNVNFTSDGAVTVGNIVVSDGGHPVFGFTDGDGDSTITISFSDNFDSTVHVGNVTARADGDVALNIGFNKHSSVTLQDVTLVSRSDSASLTIAHNTDASVGSDASVSIGNIVMQSSDGSSVRIENNSDATPIHITSITMEGFDGEGKFSDNGIDSDATWSNESDLYIGNNDDSSIRIGAITMNSGYSLTDTTLVFSDNDGAHIHIGEVNISSGGLDGTLIEVRDQTGTELNIDGLTVNAGYGDVDFLIQNNTDGAVDVGNVSLTTSDGMITLAFSDNAGLLPHTASSIGLGDVTLDSQSGSVNVELGAGRNVNTDIVINSFDITATSDVEFHISGNTNDQSFSGVGDITITAGEYFSDGSMADNGGDVNFTLDNVSDAGNITITATGTVNFLAAHFSDQDTTTVSITAGEDINAKFSDVSSIDSITITAGFSDSPDVATVSISHADSLDTLTVSGYDATVQLDWTSDGTPTIDVSGVTHSLTLDLSEANFNSAGAFTTIDIGNTSDVTIMNDVYVSDAADGNPDESREKFVFGMGAFSDGADDVGDVTITDFRPGAFAANSPPALGGPDNVWSDRLDFSHLAGVDSLEDLTFTVVGTDVVIDFVDADYGSITLTGVAADYVNSTDLVAASIIF